MAPPSLPIYPEVVRDTHPMFRSCPDRLDNTYACFGRLPDDSVVSVPSVDKKGKHPTPMAITLPWRFILSICHFTKKNGSHREGAPLSAAAFHYTMGLDTMDRNPCKTPPKQDFCQTINLSSPCSHPCFRAPVPHRSAAHQPRPPNTAEHGMRH